MRTSATVTMHSEVTIKTENIISSRVVGLNRLPNRFQRTVLSGFLAVTVNMMKRKKLLIGFTATRTDVSVGFKKFSSSIPLTTDNSVYHFLPMLGIVFFILPSDSSLYLRIPGTIFPTIFFHIIYICLVVLHSVSPTQGTVLQHNQTIRAEQTSDQCSVIVVAAPRTSSLGPSLITPNLRHALAPFENTKISVVHSVSMTGIQSHLVSPLSASIGAIDDSLRRTRSPAMPAPRHARYVHRPSITVPRIISFHRI